MVWYKSKYHFMYLNAVEKPASIHTALIFVKLTAQYTQMVYLFSND